MLKKGTKYDDGELDLLREHCFPANNKVKDEVNIANSGKQPNQPNQPNQPINITPHQTIQNASNVAINNINTINSNNTNNIYIVNNVQVIMPFSYENISFLSKVEIEEILSIDTTDAVFMLMKKIYERHENQNFYKQNQNKKFISILNNKCKLESFEQDSFYKTLFLNGLYQYLRIIYEYKEQCKTNINLNNLMKITRQYVELKKNVSNLEKTKENIELHSRIENYINTHFGNYNDIARDNNNQLRNESYNDDAIMSYFEDMYNTTREKLEKIESELNPDIKDSDIIKSLGQCKDFDISDETLQIQLKTEKFCNSDIKKYYKQRIVLEKSLINKNPKLGNIFLLNQRIDMYNRKLQELDKYSNSVDM
jgi:hypothetical protein